VVVAFKTTKFPTAQHRLGTLTGRKTWPCSAKGPNRPRMSGFWDCDPIRTPIGHGARSGPRCPIPSSPATLLELQQASDYKHRTSNEPRKGSILHAWDGEPPDSQEQEKDASAEYENGLVTGSH
jgi:hypothetical protein